MSVESRPIRIFRLTITRCGDKESLGSSAISRT